MATYAIYWMTTETPPVFTMIDAYDEEEAREAFVDELIFVELPEGTTEDQGSDPGDESR